MRPAGAGAGAALAWEFGRRHRWGLAAVALYLLVLAAVKQYMVRAGIALTLDKAEMFAIVVVVPLSCLMLYFLAVFTFGHSGDLAARESMFPKRLLTLPVTNDGLAGWPMLYGCAVMLALWIATRAISFWPPGVEIPVHWPGLLAMVVLAWAQAVTWMPYGLRGVRVAAAMTLLVVIDTIVLVALHFKASELAVSAFLLPQLPLAYLVARFAVARARRGDVPDWSGAFAWFGGLARDRRAAPDFPSPASAQAWFEWRRHGWTLPTWVAVLLPLELALLWAAGDSAALVFTILIGVLLTPTLMAAFTAATVRKSNPDARDALGVGPFIATRPLTNGALIAAKLRMTVWSTLITWAIVAVAIPAALVLSDTADVVLERGRRLADAVGTPRTVIVTLLLLAVFATSTWKQLVQSLWVGLSGREKIVNASVFLALALLTFAGPTLIWLSENRGAIAALLDAMPRILAVLVAIKMAGAVWVAVRLERGRVLSDRVMITGAACWVAAVLALYALLEWIFWTPHAASYFLLLIAMLLVPLGRLSAAPLALAWNRHR